MTATTPSAFALPAARAAKADPALIGVDEAHFAFIDASLTHEIADLSARLDVTRRAPGRSGQEALDRDLEVHRLTARLGSLQRFGLDLCLGHMVFADQPDPVYVGRLGLTDEQGRHLLVDWRSPAAEPFFAATHADPMGLTSRRRYHWTRGRITDYWDEVFTLESEVAHRASLDDQSAFVASLGVSRSDRMRDVLATIAADQDAIIRAGSAGALVVDGGPGTGKTVVALHRAAYLLYADPRLGGRRGGLLFVGPHQPYLDYVSDVLPSLGENDVQTCTVRQLVEEGDAARPERDAAVARLKASAQMITAIDEAVAFYEEPPKRGMTVSTDFGDVWIAPEAWAVAFEAPEPGTPHNEARDQVLSQLLDLVLAGGDGNPRDGLREALLRDADLRAALQRSWPILNPDDLVGDLWTVPAYLRRCAPWLSADEVTLLQRSDPDSWTVSDLPLLDAARARLGDPELEERRRRADAALAVERARMAEVIDGLQHSDDDWERVLMSTLRHEDLRDSLVDEAVVEAAEPDRLTGPFAHIVVDEAQELTDAEWQMLLRRCPSRSFTIVGDRAQARHGFTETWEERLRRVGFGMVEHATLTINYRTPEEVMAAAEPVIRAAIPDANVPRSVRSTGVPVRHGLRSELPALLDAWLAEHTEGIACVIGDPGFPASDRVRCLTPELAKGLEFDLVVLVDPDRLGSDIEGAVDRYVAMTRATQQLVILS
ncbi:MAG: RNA polymerase recycling motor ATPase HelR [Candidatus Nanopelagicales bacterium]